MRKALIIAAAVLVSVGILGYGVYSLVYANEVVKTAALYESAGAGWKEELAEKAMLEMEAEQEKISRAGEPDGYPEEVKETAESEALPAARMAAETETIPAEQEEVLQHAAVGEWIETGGGIAFELLSCRESEEGVNGRKAREGMKFAVFEVYAEDIGNGNRYVETGKFDCYADGYLAEVYCGLDSGFNEYLTPGRGTSGEVFCEIPEDAKEIELEYQWGSAEKERVIFDFTGGIRVKEKPIPARVQSDNAVAIAKTAVTEKAEIQFVSSESIGEEYCEEGFENRSFEVNVKNCFGEDINGKAGYEFCCYADGYACRESSLSVWKEFRYEEIAPGRSVNGSICFEVPKDAGVIEFELIDGGNASENLVFRAE